MMRIFPRPVCLTLTLAAVVAAATALPAAAQKKSKSEELRLARDYALAACVTNRYRGDKLGDEADIWATGLVERGSAPGDFYRKLAEYVRASAPEPESSRSGTAMRLKSCVDFYNSRALAEQIGKLLK